MAQPPSGRKLPEASEGGQKPPTDANATRQRYQLGCHEGSAAAVSTNSRQRTRSRQFNRGNGGGGRSGGGY